jgi:N-formylglutamate amidohydrolase
MKPMKPRCRLIGENGNIFNLMGIVSKTLKEAGESEKAEEMIQRITNQAKSYDEALAMLMEYVDIE